MVRSILYPSVKCMRQEMLIKEGYQVLHNCAFVQDSWEEKELNIKPKTLEEIRTELGVCRSPVFCCNSQLTGGDNHVIKLFNYYEVPSWLLDLQKMRINYSRMKNCFVFFNLAWLYRVRVIHSSLLAVGLFQCCIFVCVHTL